jgi:hypothetical protein
VISPSGLLELVARNSDDTIGHTHNGVADAAPSDVGSEVQQVHAADPIDDR